MCTSKLRLHELWYLPLTACDVFCFTTLLHVQEQHRRRPSLEELKAQGIYRTPEQIEADERQHKAAAAFLQQELEHR